MAKQLVISAFIISAVIASTATVTVANALARGALYVGDDDDAPIAYDDGNVPDFSADVKENERANENVNHGANNNDVDDDANHKAAADDANAAKVVDDAFLKYMDDFGKEYSTDEEAERRRHIFFKNMARAAELQSTNHFASFGATVFSDLDEEEFKTTYHNGEEFFARAAEARKQREDDGESSGNKPIYRHDEIAEGGKIDWREKGLVTDVKDQGNCGSCWAFSAVGSIEGAWAAAGHTLVSLSEEQLVSCDNVDSGCGGGFMSDAFTWLLDNTQGKIATLEAYPYTSGAGISKACDSSIDYDGAAKISAYLDLPKDEDQIAQYVLDNCPVSVAVCAASFQAYKSGIITDCFHGRVDHGVVVVGYDNDNVPPYWIIKNSWGTAWGEKGYVRVGKGTDQCRISSLASAVKV